MARKKILDILVLANTPPPFTGQAISTKLMLDGIYSRVRLHHVRMSFSKEIGDFGSFSLRKVFHLFALIATVAWGRFKYSADVLYYVPAGMGRIPLYRDILILISLRWLFPKTVFQFRAAGTSQQYEGLSAAGRFFYRRAYFKPDLAIRLSALTPDDGGFLHARKQYIVANGLPDIFSRYRRQASRAHTPPVILFAGAIRETKGVMVLLDACRILNERGLDFALRIMGAYKSQGFKTDVEAFIEHHGLGEKVIFPGMLTGDEKWMEYAAADLMCFPTFYEIEAMPRVVIEAMNFELPVVASSWRAIPGMVEDGSSGYLVPVRDSETLAARLAELLDNPGLRQSMGKRGRELYLEHFTVEIFWREMETAFLKMS